KVLEQAQIRQNANSDGVIDVIAALVTIMADEECVPVSNDFNTQLTIPASKRSGKITSLNKLQVKQAVELK
ncbi:hypothetical protein DFQ27_001024, partial [Actinomortierella ambigua]